METIHVTAYRAVVVAHNTYVCGVHLGALSSHSRVHLQCSFHNLGAFAICASQIYSPSHNLKAAYNDDLFPFLLCAAFHQLGNAVGIGGRVVAADL